MLELKLDESIKKFVRNVRVVRLRHLKHFFEDRGTGVCENTIQWMLTDNILHRQRENDDIVSLVYPEKLPSPLPTYNSTLRCLDALTGILHSKEVIWCEAGDFPIDLQFLTVGDELYDMTYLDGTNLSNKCALLPIAWKKRVPAGMEDPFNHIAVVPSILIAQKLRDMPFTQFVVVHGNGGIDGIYDNE